jgi:Ribonuclease G/E
MDSNLKTSKPGIVDKIVKSPLPDEPDKAQIVVKGAEPLYREIRIENKLEDASGNQVELKEGAHITVTVKADRTEAKLEP